MKTELLSPTADGLKAAAELLRQSHVVGLPTETVYGLAGNIFDADALARIFSAKERPTFDPLIAHVPLSRNSLDALAELELVDPGRLSAEAVVSTERLIRAFWPGALTLVLPKTTRVPDLATSGLQTVAVRMPNHPVAQQLLSEVGFPLAAPSANRFGRISPTSAADVIAELDGRISAVLDGGRCDVGVESTIVRIEDDGGGTVLRPGGVSVERLEAVLERPLSRATRAVPEGVAAQAPGQLESHYAPRKFLIQLTTSPSALSQTQIAALNTALEHAMRVGLLVVSGNPAPAKDELERLSGKSFVALSLSPSESETEAAKNLFSSLRALDASSTDVLVALPCPWSGGLGFAIADRLKRASALRI